MQQLYVSTCDILSLDHAVYTTHQRSAVNDQLVASFKLPPVNNHDMADAKLLHPLLCFQICLSHQLLVFLPPQTLVRLILGKNANIFEGFPAHHSCTNIKTPVKVVNVKY